MSGSADGSSEDYAEVRRKLVERGYLDGRIERFVLRDLLRPAGARGRLPRTSLKAALLGGPILGALLAGAVVAANRPLVRVTDAPVLWLYFAALSASALFALDLGAAALTAAIARRRGARSGDSTRASLLVALPTLSYLVLLWWKGPGASGLWGDAVFLVAASGATILVAWLAGLVSLAGIIGRTGEVPDRARRALRMLVAVLAPAAAAALVLRGAVPRVPGETAPSPFEPIRRGDRLVLIGADGLDGGLVEELAPRGAVDRIQELLRSGSVHPLRRVAGLEPPEVWTTMLTGVAPEVHGVREAGAERLPGVATPLRREGAPLPLEAALRFLLPARTVPTTGALRRVRTLWEIVGLKEPVAAVGWWASWPAREDEVEAPLGYVVSDRVLAKLISGSEEDRDTSPESLFPRLRAEFPRERDLIRSVFEARFGSVGDAELRRLAWESFLLDAYHRSVARLLEGDPAVRDLFVYLPGLEILRHRLAERGRGKDGNRAAAVPELIESYVKWIDGLVGEIAGDPATRRTILIADPGRSAVRGVEGFVAVSGGPARPGCVGSAIGPLDVTPLALTADGFPASDEMPGRAPTDCLASPPGGATRIATFGRKAAPARPPVSAYDPEMLDRLRSLGYVR